MAYTPDITRYQQIQYGGVTGPFDCTAWSAAIVTDAHTQGAVKLSGRAVRLASDEPIPDRYSPGLTLPQVDAAVLDLTKSRVDLDTHVQGRALTRVQVRNRIVDGRWAIIQVNRGVLVQRGFLNGFSGGHAISVHHRDTDGIPIIGDPLVAHYVGCSWDAVFDAAEALTGGWIYSSLSRDLTPDYQFVLKPTPPATIRAFYQFVISNGAIVSTHKAYTRGMRLKCTPPRYYPAAAGKPKTWSRQLVQIVAPGHPRDGWFVNARYAEEIVP